MAWVSQFLVGCVFALITASVCGAGILAIWALLNLLRWVYRKREAMLLDKLRTWTSRKGFKIIKQVRPPIVQLVSLRGRSQFWVLVSDGQFPFPRYHHVTYSVCEDAKGRERLGQLGFEEPVGGLFGRDKPRWKEFDFYAAGLSATARGAVINPLWDQWLDG